MKNDIAEIDRNLLVVPPSPVLTDDSFDWVCNSSKDIRRTYKLITKEFLSLVFVTNKILLEIYWEQIQTATKLCQCKERVTGIN